MKKLTILLLAAVLASGLAACGKKEEPALSPAQTENAASPSAASSPSASPDAVSETKQGTGEFVGLADSHTVEITMAGESASFQFDENTTSMTGFKTGDQVAFEYVEKALEGKDAGKQLILTKINKELIANGKGGGTNQAGGSVQPEADLPATKEFTLTLEGDKEKRTGKLAEAGGYALYVFDGFTFDAAVGKLSMDIDKDYYVEIEKLPSGFKWDEIKTDAEKELAALGEVRELKADEISPMLGGASLMMIGSSDKLTNEVIVKEVDGIGYLIKVNMPHTEASEGFGPFAFTSLSSISNQ
ncbi:hypothetical protein SD71_21065 [Cohnella kolymensis]|uniref:Lipoprotein n=2 Tax=Cohnella kolymensis TaxID=1590652 RepID=A0ABR4ZZL7_9BACL|nr:hypothetical protein SD71_21065 [Cohnella kolymensis]